MAEVTPPKNGTILELGPGHDDQLEHYLNNGHNVIAVDYSPEVIKHLQKRLKRYIRKGKLTLIEGHYAEALKTPAWKKEQVDHVIAIAATESHLHTETLFKTIHGALKTGGTVTIMELTPIYTELVEYLQKAGLIVEKVKVKPYLHPNIRFTIPPVRDYYTIITSRKP